MKVATNFLVTLVCATSGDEKAFILITDVFPEGGNLVASIRECARNGDCERRLLIEYVASELIVRAGG